jgi:hypothetical protein
MKLPIVQIVWGVNGSIAQCPSPRTPGEIICSTSANESRYVYRVGDDGISLGLVGRTRDRVQVYAIITSGDIVIDPSTAPIVSPSGMSTTQPDDRD